MRTHLSYDGFMVKSAGAYLGTGGTLLSTGRLINPHMKNDNAPRVQIFYVPGKGYQYKE